jgi:hypothetical protein
MRKNRGGRLLLLIFLECLVCLFVWWWGVVIAPGNQPQQRLHRQVPFALPVIAIVPVVIAVVLATTLAPARAGAARMSGRCEAPSRRCCRMTAL